MQTETATAILAEYYEHGEIITPLLRAAMDTEGLTSTSGAWAQYHEAVEAHTLGPRHKRASAESVERAKPRELRLMDFPGQATALARNWEWSRVDHLIRIMYRLLHADPPAVHNDDHGYAFHRGEHPIQQTAHATV